MRVLCIDVGGSYIKPAVIDSSGRMMLTRIVTPMENLEAFLNAIRAIYLSAGGIDGIALSMPGVIDEITGFMYTGGALCFIQNLDMIRYVQAICGGLPVSVFNDAKSGAIAELESGALRDAQSGVIMTIGTGLGGAVIHERKVIAGSHHFAGEFSFILVRDNEPGKPYKTIGMSGGSNRVVELYLLKTGHRDDKLIPEDVFRFAETGDNAASAAIADYCDELSVILANIQCVTDPEIIAIGGGISAQAMFVALVKERAAKLQRDSGSMAYGMPAIRVEACRYRDNTMGAYYLFLRQHPQR
ncbi:MAG: ROK family protein [Synergistaceae bacterium]|jgi:predicted NBD/HSP70 family sugar kinase|nr:ROK family protein [Synergistaceae bacterium]